MARVQTMVQLNDELVELLDREAARLGVSRSALIRSLIEEHLRDAREASVSEQIVRGYQRIPPATPDEWGALEELSDRAALDTLHRLDADERAAGHGSW